MTDSRHDEPRRESTFAVASSTYHLAELEIALDPTRSGHVLPPIAPHYRHVLDVGCGAGQSLVACGLHAPDSTTLGFGVDVDDQALALGRTRWPTLQLAAASGEALPFADASFDFVFSRVALPYMDVRTAAREFRRVLRPGGELWMTLHPLRLALTDLRGAVRRLAWRAVVHRTYVLGNGLLLHSVGATRAFPVGRLRTESWQSARGMRLALGSAGFAGVQTQRSGATFIVTARTPSEGSA